MFPPESKEHFTSLTPQALHYVGEDTLMHKLVLAGERSFGNDDASRNATRSLREMLSEKELRKGVAERDESGGYKTKNHVTRGPIAYVESTTAKEIFEEDKNRCIIAPTDDSPEQTRRVLLEIAKNVGMPRCDSKQVLERQHAIHRLLEKREVIVPYATELAKLLPDAYPDWRRTIRQILSAIMACALLFQKQRPTQDGCIVSILDDYEIVVKLFARPLQEGAEMQVSPAAIELHKLIAAAYELGKTFTVSDILSLPNCNRRKDSVYNAVSSLQKVGALSNSGTTQNKATLYCLKKLPGDYSLLPSREALEQAVAESRKAESEQEAQ
ncbi:MAG TPA: hypothetical protein DDW52_30300 [Planctomycetaceae bacterium]|nr:hypothetical protein [Planctomycetaceae bacterium]